MHKDQIETHEIISGSGIYIYEGRELVYRPGSIGYMKENTEHEIIAGKEGLFIFAKFFPALL